jgi:predicted nucleotidyltransferase
MDGGSIPPSSTNCHNDDVLNERMKEMTMLDPDDVDLDELAEALEDHSADISYGHSWWLDPSTGEVKLYSADADEETADDLDDAGLIFIEPMPSSVGYSDMEDFIELVPDRRPRDLLERAIEGRGAFRRFKDTLFEFPELREEWFAFRDARARRRATEWLTHHGLISAQRAREVEAHHPDPAVGGRLVSLPRAVAADLRALYSDRLIDVFVFGSRARGDNDLDADLDLLVVLDALDDPWAEHRRMEETLWRHTIESGTVVTALPVSRERFENPDEPVLIRARAESIPA